MKVDKASSYVSQIERNVIKNPDYKTATNLLQVLQIPEAYIAYILRILN
jgi:transcriptional regulator with XRE-family HTH domain